MNASGVEPGTLYGVGVGPGDPELLTLRALRVLQGVDLLVHFAKRGQRGVARGIADRALDGARRAEELALIYPMTTEMPADGDDYAAALGGFYDEAAETVAGRLDGGASIAVLCEGDPLLYGSYMHLHRRLAGRHPVEVVPGVTGMSGCWSRARTPMTWGDDVLSVVPGTLPPEALARRLAECDAAVVMKLGRNLPKVRAAVAAAGLTDRAVYVERGTMPGERVMPLAEAPAGEAPYFSIVLIPGQGRRP